MEKLNNLTKAFEALQLQFSEGLQNQTVLAQKLKESEEKVAELTSKDATSHLTPAPSSTPTPLPNEDASMEDPELDPKKKAADLAKLRRLCELKADGTCKVTTELHEMWKGGGAGRSKLLKMFVESGYDKDLRVSLIYVFFILNTFNTIKHIYKNYSMVVFAVGPGQSNHMSNPSGLT